MDTNTTKDPNPQTLLQNVWSTWRYFLTVYIRSVLDHPLE
jgi:hypothetical protein